jgi:hypothetical protein
MLRTRLIAVTIACAAALGGPLSGSYAAKPNCGTEILTTSVKGNLSAWYSKGCYARALKLLTPDLKQYSDAPAAISTAARRDRLRKLRIVIAKRAAHGRVKITFTPAVGTIRVAIFAKKGGRFVPAAVTSVRGKRATIRARLGTAKRIRVSVGYVGSGDRPIVVSTTVKR